MRRALWAWFIAVVLIIFLYVGVAALWVNKVKPTILGMPLLYTWFVIVPLLNPIILGALYLYDKRHNPQAEEVSSDVR
ncbi:Protein of unknown function DUF3311 [Acididesulfobacillus acetoxydans]|uniref:Uncharacterized protein n=1 Tax=Acididesulfobacillus acetoxydans TaxID=1561005 RepID=A0A8S0Y0F0_9FIRM|nr:hypothetical protein [Acididesulfobacillus acetoxydans]CAA7603087.1 Protein of unknown function DUF3311 [Acididesulfobacillus acetoxydans]CEJ05675.1 Protein of unknown function (DUF3311) [Acididesulfobacillus acetoxydans]